MANAISDNASKIPVVSDVLLNHIVTLANATHLAAILEEGDKPKRKLMNLLQAPAGRGGGYHRYHWRADGYFRTGALLPRYMPITAQAPGAEQNVLSQELAP
ncbi:hypothetical protein [Paenibacillus popilliae]|uniref:hypothetical protein n=1 Tax=Paenibacillus popilliae TaxID=78057 RepID=UPI0002F2F5FE|nr:hypothetical protein [Paenibacillus popilliae]